MGRLALAFWLMLASAAAWPQTLLVPAGDAWKYLDNGSNQGTAWRGSAFDDSSWPVGTAKLGYGDGDEATLLGYGGNASAKHVTYYFRKAFVAPNPAGFSTLKLRLRRDDGVVVYLNGNEVHRDNMPAGAVAYTTLAANVAADDGATWQSATIATALLVQGTNVLAIEIHQASASSSDVSFDLELSGLTGSTAAVTRGPYLQIGTPSSVVVRWRTNIATDTRVQYGTSPTALSASAGDGTLGTEHSIKLSNLTSGTRYYYAVGTGTGMLAGGDSNHYFVTAPSASSPRASRIWVIGDAGTGTADQARVRDAYANFTGSRHTDLWLQLGDNAYENGTDAEYQSTFFDVYASLLRRSVTWPTIGNHDTAGSTSPPSTLPYFQMFSLPTAGQAGGVASGSKNYYSFDFGNIHFVCLDSMASSRTAGSAMLSWLQADLAANTKEWLVAYWHHPPYSKGSHDSDVDIESIEMRQNVLPLLESFGVDIVLTGHSHSYERSFLIDGHYGLSATFSGSMKKNGGSGRSSESGAYTKPPGASSHQGTVYAVAGASGKLSGGALNHPAMFISLNRLGSLVIDVDGSRLDATYLADNGGVADSFTILKGSATNQPPVLGVVANQNTAVGQSVSLALSASDADGDALSYSAIGLPAGLSIAATSGLISGSPSSVGTFGVTTSVSDGRGGIASRSFTWTVTSGGGSGSQPVQYVKFEALSEINGKPYASMAEFNVLDTAGVPIPRSSWSVSADSQELQGENGAATNAIDGNAESIWHTQWYAAKPPMPHQLVVNLGAARAVGGFKYLPRPSSSGVNGTVVGWRLYTSNDGVNWVQIASGNFAADSTEKTVYPVR